MCLEGFVDSSYATKSQRHITHPMTCFYRRSNKPFLICNDQLNLLCKFLSVVCFFGILKWFLMKQWLDLINKWIDKNVLNAEKTEIYTKKSNAGKLVEFKSFWPIPLAFVGKWRVSSFVEWWEMSLKIDASK